MKPKEKRPSSFEVYGCSSSSKSKAMGKSCRFAPDKGEVEPEVFQSGKGYTKFLNGKIQRIIKLT
jgi:hypothetical protein